MTSVLSRITQGKWLWLWRAAWLLLSGLTLSIYALALFAFYTGWSQPCSQHSGEALGHCLAHENAFAQLNISRQFFAAFITVGLLIEVLPWLLAGLLIFWRKSGVRFELLFSLMLVVTGTMNLDRGIPIIVNGRFPALQPLVEGLDLCGALLLLVWLLFPDGRFAHPHLRWAALVIAYLQVSNNLLYNTPLAYGNWPQPLPALVESGTALMLVLAILYRYRYTATPTMRQQIKWIAASSSLLGSLYVVQQALFYFYPAVGEPGLPSVVRTLTLSALFYLSSGLVGASIAVSIFRYRLWEIDFLINRALIYGAVTVLLAGMMGGSLLLAAQVVEGQALTMVFGGAALAGGLLFDPLRRTIQRLVDQRLYHIYIDYQPKARAAVLPAAPALRQANLAEYAGLELIGRGGMAEVYKAQDAASGETVAIKVLPARLSNQPDFRQRFGREAQIAQRLQHPRIVRVFAHGEHEGASYLVMEYLPGKDLGELLKTQPRLSLEQTLRLLEQVAAALDYAHQQGVVHRDIKPGNIMLGTDESGAQRAVLTDFGVAKILDAHTAMTGTGSMLGTLDYMAPEQIQASAEVDGRADVYALGVVAFQLLTGRLPFQHANAGAILIAHLTQPPPDASELVKDLPPAAGQVIQQALAKSPAERYASAGAFMAALRACTLTKH